MPKAVLPDDIDATVRVMRDFLTNPIDLEGKTAAELLRKKRKKAINRKKRTALEMVNSEDEEVMVERPIKRRKKRAAELQHYKSAAYIEDSDDAAEADEGFYRRELELREISRQKMMAAGHTGDLDSDTVLRGPTTQKQARTVTQTQSGSSEDEGGDEFPASLPAPTGGDDLSAQGQVSDVRTLAARPAPRRRTKRKKATLSPSGETDEDNQTVEGMEGGSDSGNDEVGVNQRTNLKRRIVAESEEDE